MILDWVNNFTFWIVDSALSVLEIIINMFPDMPEAVTLLPDNMMTYMAWVGNIINVEALTTVIFIFVTYEVFMISARFILWLWRLTPLS